VKRFGKKKLRDITIQDAQNFRTWLLSKKGANYSQSYASLSYGTFKRTLEFAVNLQYLTINVASKVKAISKGKAPVQYWTKDDFEQVITKIYIEDFYDHLIFVMLWVYFNTGVRVNEGCALWWSDINFSKKQMRVSHMLKLKTKTDWQRQNYTKTESGNRIISLDDDTIEILKIWKKRQLDMGVTTNFIFSYDGAPMMKSTIGRNIKKYAKEAGVPEIQVKGLRHSHASYLINELNVNVLIISKRLGHSSPDITLKHYAHMWAGADQELALNMTGRIAIKTAQQKFFYFNGNQAIKRTVSKNVSRSKQKH
jgi:integrase